MIIAMMIVVVVIITLITDVSIQSGQYHLAPLELVQLEEKLWHFHKQK